MKHTIATALAIIMAAAMPAFAMGRQPSQEVVSIKIVSDTGRTFQAIPHDDFWKGSTHIFKKYLVARKGEKYGIIIGNKSSDRIGVVIAVDGRNIISGRQSDLAGNENMYIVNPHETVQYDGWRTSQDQIHRFYFTDETDSYTVKTFADASALGVIAVAVYKEKQQRMPQLERKGEAPAAGTPLTKKAEQGADRALANESAGTGFGDARYSPVITVQFNPERAPIQQTLIKYEWREVLCMKGVMRCSQQFGNRLWDDQYAPYPPGYPKN